MENTETKTEPKPPDLKKPELKLSELEVDALVATTKDSLVYVHDGREYTKTCTPDVVECVNHRGYTAQKTRNYVLTFAGDQIVSVVPGADNIMQRGLKRADADWQTVPKQVLVFHRVCAGPVRGLFKVLAAPDRHAKIATKIGAELDKRDSIQPGQELQGGKFQVLETRHGIGNSEHILVVQKTA